MVGPDIGVAWEKWKTPNRGFTTELHLLFPQNYTGSSSFTQGCGYVSVPLLWNFRMRDRWAVKVGLQPNLIFYLTNENRDGPHMFFCPDIQVPVCFSYHPIKRFSLDFKLSLGLVGGLINIPSIFIFMTPLPIHSSASVTAGWKFFKE